MGRVEFGLRDRTYPQALPTNRVSTTSRVGAPAFRSVATWLRTHPLPRGGTDPAQVRVLSPSLSSGGLHDLKLEVQFLTAEDGREIELPEFAGEAQRGEALVEVDYELDS